MQPPDGMAILVTGSTQGVGAEIAREAARLAVYRLGPRSGLQTGTCIDPEQRVAGAP